MLPTPSQATLRVLLVDGDAEVALALVKRLGEGLGATVHLAGTSAEADERLAPNNYDMLVVADELPDGGGLALVAAARARAPDTPVLFLAPPGREGVALRAMALGAAAHVPTGVDVAEDALRAARAALTARGRIVVDRGDEEIVDGGVAQALVRTVAHRTASETAARAVEAVLRRGRVAGAAVFTLDGTPLHARLDAAPGAEALGVLALRLQASAAALARLAGLEPAAATAGSLCTLDVAGMRLALGPLGRGHLGVVAVAPSAGPLAAAEALLALADAMRATES